MTLHALNCRTLLHLICCNAKALGSSSGQLPVLTGIHNTKCQVKSVFSSWAAISKVVEWKVMKVQLATLHLFCPFLPASLGLFSLLVLKPITAFIQVTLQLPWLPLSAPGT